MTAHRYDAPELAFTIGAEAADVIAVTLKARRREFPPQRLILRVFLSDDAEGDGIIAAAPSGGVAAGTKGFILAEEVADKILTAITDAAGELILNITHVGAKTLFVVVAAVSGEVFPSRAVTFV